MTARKTWRCNVLLRYETPKAARPICIIIILLRYGTPKAARPTW